MLFHFERGQYILGGDLSHTRQKMEMKLEKEEELVKACGEEVRIINQTNGEGEQVCRGNSLMEQKAVE